MKDTGDNCTRIVHAPKQCECIRGDVPQEKKKEDGKGTASSAAERRFPSRTSNRQSSNLEAKIFHRHVEPFLSMNQATIDEQFHSHDIC